MLPAIYNVNAQQLSTHDFVNHLVGFARMFAWSIGAGSLVVPLVQSSPQPFAATR
jgi:hypothetical protein